MKTDEQIKSAASAMTAPYLASEVLGNVLSEGARLISEGKIPKDVIAEKTGDFALCLIDGNADAVRELKSGACLTVGRCTPCDAMSWQVDDKWLSKEHFRISVDSEGVPQIEDLASLNGTFVNDRAISSTRALVRGDCIRAGHSLFLFL